MPCSLLWPFPARLRYPPGPLLVPAGRHSGRRSPGCSPPTCRPV